MEYKIKNNIKKIKILSKKIHLFSLNNNFTQFQLYIITLFFDYFIKN